VKRFLPSRQFFLFSIVGTISFVIDAGTLRLGMSLLGLGYYEGRVLSFLTAAVSGYLMNRRFTFTAAPRKPGAKQGALYVLMMTAGFAVNYGTYAMALMLHPLVRDYPELGVAAGSIAGLGVNYLSARFVVFRH